MPLYATTTHAAGVLTQAIGTDTGTGVILAAGNIGATDFGGNLDRDLYVLQRDWFEPYWARSWRTSLPTEVARRLRLAGAGVVLPGKLTDGSDVRVYVSPYSWREPFYAESDTPVAPPAVTLMAMERTTFRRVFGRVFSRVN